MPAKNRGTRLRLLVGKNILSLTGQPQAWTAAKARFDQSPPKVPPGAAPLGLREGDLGQRVPLALVDRIDARSRSNAAAEPGHPGQNNGVGDVRQSATKLRDPNWGIPSMVRMVEGIFDGVRIHRYKLPNGRHILVAKNTSGLDVEGRWDLDLIQLLAELGLIEHVVTPLPGRLARSSQAEALRFVGVLADHRIKVHCIDRSYNLGERADRILFIQKLADAEEEAERIFLLTVGGKRDSLLAGNYVMPFLPFGTRRSAGRQLRYLPGSRTKIRALWFELLRRDPSTAAQFADYTKWAARHLHRPLLGQKGRQWLREVLTDPTYEGCYHLFRRWSTRKPHMNISQGVDLGRVHRILKHLQRLPPEALDFQAVAQLDAVEIARLAGARIEEFIENGNLLLVCRKPKCRRAALRRLDDGIPPVVRNGGAVVNGIYYQTYLCERCRKPVLLCSREQGESLVRGYKCGKCGTPDHWTLEAYPKFLSGVLDDTYAFLFRITCKACGHEQYLRRHHWKETQPFAEELRRQSRLRRPRRQAGCVCLRPGTCKGRCSRIRKQVGQGRSDTEIAEREGVTRGYVKLRRDRMGLKANPKKYPRRKIDHVAALEMHRRGCNDAVIARRFGASNASVIQWRRKHGLLAVGRPVVVIPRIVLARLCRAGFVDTEIARHLGLPLKRVQGERQRYGLHATHLRTTWTPRDGIRARRFVRMGLTTYDISRLLGVHHGTVTRWARGARIEMRRPQPTTGQILERYRQGASDGRIATELGMSSRRVGRWRRSLRLPPNPPFRPPFDPLRALLAHREAHSLGELANTLAAHPRKVAKWLHLVGLPIPGQNRRPPRDAARRARTRRRSATTLIPASKPNHKKEN